MGSDQKRALIAVIISGIFLFGWQKTFAPKPSLDETSKTDSPVVPKVERDPVEIIPSVKFSKDEKISEARQSSVDSAVSVSSFGKIEIDKDLSINDFRSDSSLFEFIDVVGEGFNNKFFVKSNAGLQPIRLMSFDTSRNAYTTNVDGLLLFLANSNRGFRLDFQSNEPVKIVVRISASSEKSDSGMFKKVKTYSNGEVEEFEFGDAKNGLVNSKWFALDFNYHILAFIVDSIKSLNIRSLENGTIDIELNGASRSHGFELLFSKKNYDYLVEQGDGLSATIEFGFFGFLAVPILRGLQFFYKYFPNYGVSIIILTLLIRLITFPLQYKSFKSMKKMQKLQPELNKLKEKYQDNPQKMQAETMELFKRSGANPLGGCLPLLLQMPVFFAFYKVLSAAVELVGAPFALWINDLSTKDPYFVLPVLLAIVMFVQQKLTPSQTADATQQKVMMFMPLIFGFIMKDLPSGLVLYIFVSTLFGIVQQLYVYKTTD